MIENVKTLNLRGRKLQTQGVHRGDGGRLYNDCDLEGDKNVNRSDFLLFLHLKYLQINDVTEKNQQIREWRIKMLIRLISGSFKTNS